jgi:hypothetical protein
VHLWLLETNACRFASINRNNGQHSMDVDHAVMSCAQKFTIASCHCRVRFKSMPNEHVNRIKTMSFFWAFIDYSSSPRQYCSRIVKMPLHQWIQSSCDSWLDFLVDEFHWHIERTNTVRASSYSFYQHTSSIDKRWHCRTHALFHKINATISSCSKRITFEDEHNSVWQLNRRFPWENDHL